MKTIFSDNDKAMAVAVFCKRVTFEDAYKRAHGETDKERTAMAYRILEGLADIEKYLAERGFAPR